jgi:hypothetical protein
MSLVSSKADNSILKSFSIVLGHCSQHWTTEVTKCMGVLQAFFQAKNKMGASASGPAVKMLCEKQLLKTLKPLVIETVDGTKVGFSNLYKEKGCVLMLVWVI